MRRNFKVNMQDQSKKAKELKDKLDSLKLSLQPEKLKQAAERLEKESLAPDFWQNQEAQEKMQELAEIKEQIDELAFLQNKISDLQELTDIAENENEQAELVKDMVFLTRKIDKLEQQTYLDGPYDKKDAILSVHAGQGGTEACDWAQMLYRMYLRYAELKKWSAKIIEERPGEEAGVKSATIIIKGRFSYGLLKYERGTHRLVRLSPFNADSLRQTSFALVQVLPLLSEQKETEIKPDDLEISFNRSSGHGGQNVNKVSTAVRLKHLPTGIVVESQNERSQEQNRKIAMSLLAAKLWAREEEERQKKLEGLREGSKMASWGSQIRSYVLHPYKMVKDLRTDHEESNPEKVLSGYLDVFINEALIKLH